MPDINQFPSALSEVQEQQLSEALSSLTPDALERVLLKTSLRNLPAQAKVRVAFRLDATLVAHSYRLRTGDLRWELPQVPSNLRPVVYSLSHLASQLQFAAQNLTNGRGDYARLYPLLAPEQLQEVVTTVRAPLVTYATRLREAMGRRESRSRQSRQAQPSTPTSFSNAESELKDDVPLTPVEDKIEQTEDAASDTFLLLPEGDSE